MEKKKVVERKMRRGGGGQKRRINRKNFKMINKTQTIIINNIYNEFKNVYERIIFSIWVVRKILH